MKKEFHADPTIMGQAIDLAKRGEGWVSPNPLVGAIIVKEGRIIGQGWHHHAGGLHAEREALKNAQEDPRGATMYVTLEPCSHYGKQPPCSQALIQAGIARVVVGSDDPNPLVHGRGFRQLEEAGVKVIPHFLKEECDQLNPVFFHYIQEKRPYVSLKTAMTLDGKTATATGDSKWVTSKETRTALHRLRHINRAIMVGIGTVLADDPLLTTRIEGLRDPIRLIADSRLRTPLDSQLVQTANQAPTWILTGVKDHDQVAPYEDQSVRVLTLPTKEGRLDLEAAMDRLAEEEVDSILLEGGASLNGSMVQAGLVQKVYFSLAPKILGGDQALTPIGGKGFEKMAQALPIDIEKITRLGPDLLIEGEVRNVHRNH